MDFTAVLAQIKPKLGCVADNLSLIEGSPCIDAGDPGLEFRDGCRSDEPCSPFARGGPRNDMGAYGGPGVCYWTQPRAEPVIRIAPDYEIGFQGQRGQAGCDWPYGVGPE